MLICVNAFLLLGFDEYLTTFIKNLIKKKKPSKIFENADVMRFFHFRFILFTYLYKLVIYKNENR